VYEKKTEQYRQTLPQREKGHIIVVGGHGWQSPNGQSNLVKTWWQYNQSVS